MKNLLRYIVIALVGALAFTSCNDDDAQSFTLYGFNPNPAVRGEAISFFGEGLDAVQTVRFVGAETTNITRLGTSISVIVPMNAQPGVIELCYPGGSYVTKSAVQFDEPLASDAVLNGFTNYDEKSNTTTMVGRKYYISTSSQMDYLSDIMRVEFAGDEAVVEFDEDGFAAALGEEPLTEEKLFELSEIFDMVRSQHLVIVTIPQSAKSGPVYLYNSNDDRFSATDIKIAQSMAQSVTPSTDIIPGYDELVVEGENFDLVVSATFTGGVTVESDAMSIAADGKSIRIKSILGMQDGPISLATKSGDVIVTPEVETIAPSQFSLWTEGDLYKSGKSISISTNEGGSDEVNYAILQQVQSIEFQASGATVAADFELNAEYNCINVAPPATAIDGAIIGKTYAGKDITFGSVALVAATFTDVPTNVDGGESFVITGENLDLIEAVELSGTACEFSVNSEATQLEVKTERTYKSGALTARQYNGISFDLLANFEINFVGEVMITSMPEQVGPGEAMLLEGSGFNKVESIYIGATKVISYTERSDSRLGFIVPAETEAGDYNLTFNLTTGDVETSAMTVTISAMELKEVALWEGSVDLAGWSGSLILPATTFAESTTETLFTLHYENQGSGQFKIMDGNWANLEMPDKSPYWEGIDAAEGSTSYQFSLSAEHLAAVQATGMVIGGQNLILTKLTHMVAVPAGGGVEDILPTDVMLNDYEAHGDHSASWDGSWADAAATEFITEDGNTYIRVCAPLTGWFVNCNHQATVGDAFGAVIDDLSKYNLKFDLKIEDGVVGASAVQMQIVLADGWFWYGEGFFPETTDGGWITVTIDTSAILTGPIDCTVGTNGLASNTPIPAGVCLDNLRLSLK